MKNIKLILLLGFLSAGSQFHLIEAQSASTVNKEISKAEQLNRAIGAGDLATVKILVEADPSLISVRAGYGNLVAISSAVGYGKIDIVKYLLEKGADPNQKNAHSGDMPLVSIIGAYGRENWRELGDLLVSKGADVNKFDSSSELPLLRVLSTKGVTDIREKVEWLLKNKADVNIRDRSSRSALSQAVANSDTKLEILKLLVDKGNLKARDSHGNTLLHIAVIRNGYEVVRLLIEKGVDINAQNIRGDTALHMVAPNPSLILKALLDAGANPNLKNTRGDLPLHIALRRTERGNSESNVYSYPYQSSPAGYFSDQETASRAPMLASLVEKTDVTIKDQYGLTPLLIAIMSRDQECRSLILDKSPKMDVITQLFSASAADNTAVLTQLLTQKPYLVYFRLPDGSTPLHISALWGTTSVAKILLAKGADPNARDSKAQTPLYRTFISPSGLFLPRAKKMATLLIENKANPSVVDKSSISPLHRAVMSREIDLVKVLLQGKSKANPNMSDERGFTPLMAAMTETTPLPIVNLLLASGAEVNVRIADIDMRGTNPMVPLTLAVSADRIDIVKALLAKGANVNYRNSDGYGILGQLMERTRNTRNAVPSKEMLSLLLESGADPNDKSSYGSIASSLAASKNENAPELITLMVKNKKIPLEENERRSLMVQAVNAGNKTTVQALIEAGIDVNEKDSQGNSPLQVARKRFDDSIVLLLKANGAVE